MFSEGWLSVLGSYRIFIALPTRGQIVQLVCQDLLHVLIIPTRFHLFISFTTMGQGKLVSKKLVLDILSESFRLCLAFVIAISVKVRFYRYVLQLTTH